MGWSRGFIAARNSSAVNTPRAPISVSIPGVNTKLLNQTLKSPNMNEFTIGAGTQIGKGYFRGDYINRKWQDFYAQFTTLSTGTVINPANNLPVDLNLAVSLYKRAADLGERIAVSNLSRVQERMRNQPPRR